MKITIKIEDSAVLQNREESYSLFETAELGLAALRREYTRQLKDDHDCKGDQCAVCAEIHEGE